MSSAVSSIIKRPSSSRRRFLLGLVKFAFGAPLLFGRFLGGMSPSPVSNGRLRGGVAGGGGAGGLTLLGGTGRVPGKRNG